MRIFQHTARGLVVLALLTLATVVVCGFAIHERYQDAAIKKQEGGLVFPDLQRQLGEIASVDVARASGSFSFTRGKDNWLNMGIGGYPAKPMQIENMIAGLIDLRYIAPKTERSKLHHKLGVEDVTANASSTRLTIKDSTGSVLASIIVGKAHDRTIEQDRQGLYIRRPGEQRAWLADGSLDVGYNSVDWSNRTVVDIDASALSTLTIKHSDGGVVALHRNRPTDQNLTLKNLPEGAVVAHQFQIDYMAELLSGLQFNDAKSIDTNATESSPAFEVIAQTNNHLGIVIRADEAEENGSTWARIEARLTNDLLATEDAKREVTRINSSFSGWSIQLPRKFTEKLKVRLSDIIKAEARAES